MSGDFDSNQTVGWTTTETIISGSDLIIATPQDAGYDLIQITYEGVDPDAILSMDGMRITMQELHTFLTQKINHPKIVPSLGAGNLIRDLPLG